MHRKGLTDHVEMDEVAHVRGGADLAFVYPRVAVLGILDLQGPVLAVGVVDSPEPLVTRVGVPAYCEQVDVSM